MGKIAISDMYCTQCGKKNIPIPRKKGHVREPGHLKKLYCIYCKKEVNMVEIRPIGTKYTYKDFLLEYKYKNFDEEGNRILTLGDFKTKMNNLMKEEVNNE